MSPQLFPGSATRIMIAVWIAGSTCSDRSYYVSLITLEVQVASDPTFTDDQIIDYEPHAFLKQRDQEVRCCKSC